MSNPYSEEAFNDRRETKPKKKNVVGWVIATLGIAFAVMCCGGGGGLMMMGMNMIAADIEVQLRDHDQLRAEVGEIQSLDVNWSKTFNDDNEDIMVFDLKGSEGNGELTVDSYTDDDGNEQIRSATLRTSDGRTVELDI